MSTKKLKSEIEIAGQPKGAAGLSKIELCVNTGIGKVAASCQGQNRQSCCAPKLSQCTRRLLRARSE
jgi:hypothetical protein